MKKKITLTVAGVLIVIFLLVVIFSIVTISRNNSSLLHESKTRAIVPYNLSLDTLTNNSSSLSSSSTNSNQELVSSSSSVTTSKKTTTSKSLSVLSSTQSTQSSSSSFSSTSPLSSSAPQRIAPSAVKTDYLVNQDESSGCVLGYLRVQVNITNNEAVPVTGVLEVKVSKGSDSNGWSTLDTWEYNFSRSASESKTVSYNNDDKVGKVPNGKDAYGNLNGCIKYKVVATIKSYQF